jgi:hypothetical protein
MHKVVGLISSTVKKKKTIWVRVLLGLEEIRELVS